MDHFKFQKKQCLYRKFDYDVYKCDMSNLNNVFDQSKFSKNNEVNHFMSMFLYHNQDFFKKCVKLGINDTNDTYKFIKDIYTKITNEFKLFISGKFFLYKKKTALGWHTNLSPNMDKGPFRDFLYRVYIIYTNSNDSYFLYLHPKSKQIHYIKDKHNYINLFHLGNKNRPLWHAVINDGDKDRLSLGISGNYENIKQLNINQDFLNDIL